MAETPFSDIALPSVDSSISYIVRLNVFITYGEWAAMNQDYNLWLNSLKAINRQLYLECPIKIYDMPIVTQTIMDKLTRGAKLRSDERKKIISNKETETWRQKLIRLKEESENSYTRYLKVKNSNYERVAKQLLTGNALQDLDKRLHQYTEALYDLMKIRKLGVKEDAQASVMYAGN